MKLYFEENLSVHILFCNIKYLDPLRNWLAGERLERSPNNNNEVEYESKAM